MPEELRSSDHLAQTILKTPGVFACVTVCYRETVLRTKELLITYVNELNFGFFWG
jgi:hypothetical protein